MISENLKYQAATLISVLCLSLALSGTINTVIKNTLLKEPYSTTESSSKNRGNNRSADKKTDTEAILDSGFFEIGDIVEEADDTEAEVEAPSQVTDLILLGTITGPVKIARAMIQNKRSKESDVFKTGQKAFGYTITWITETKVYLTFNGQKAILDMYPPKTKSSSSKSSSTSSAGSTVKQNLSRAEINQILEGNQDNLIKGLRIGPHRENGKITGYTLKRVSSQNMLYKFGLRSGDIIKRINGHPITSTEKLMELWQAFPKESRIVIDVVRRRKEKVFDFTIND